jgi:hypothetical protein
VARPDVRQPGYGPLHGDHQEARAQGRLGGRPPRLGAASRRSQRAIGPHHAMRADREYPGHAQWVPF